MAKDTKKTNVHEDVVQVEVQEDRDAEVKLAEASEGGNLAVVEKEATPSVAGAGEGEVTEGTRVRRVIALKNLLPNADWINQNVVAGGKGTRATVGRIYGVAMSTSRRTNTMPDGSVVESIAVSGLFNSESFVTGEVSEGSTVYFPMAYAEKIESTFKMLKDVKIIEVDCDIGLEATGKTIPYEWVTTAYLEGEEMAVLKKMRAKRAKPAQLVLTAAQRGA